MIVLHGKSTVAGFMQRGSKTVEATVAGTSTPEAKPLFDLLGKDYTALQELFDRYGLVCSPKHIEPASFKALKVGLARALTGLLETRTDVVLNHMEILVLAELFRPVVPQMLSIIASADNIRVEGGR